jgi:hypothetical protein
MPAVTTGIHEAIDVAVQTIRVGEGIFRVGPLVLTQLRVRAARDRDLGRGRRDAAGHTPSSGRAPVGTGIPGTKSPRSAASSLQPSPSRHHVRLPMAPAAPSRSRPVARCFPAKHSAAASRPDGRAFGARRVPFSAAQMDQIGLSQPTIAPGLTFRSRARALRVVGRHQHLPGADHAVAYECSPHATQRRSSSAIRPLSGRQIGVIRHLPSVAGRQAFVVLDEVPLVVHVGRDSSDCPFAAHGASDGLGSHAPPGVVGSLQTVGDAPPPCRWPRSAWRPDGRSLRVPPASQVERRSPSPS